MERLLLTVDDYRRAAIARMPGTLHDYFKSGADGQRTLRENRHALRRRTLWPRVLVDVDHIDCSTTVLGKKRPHPIFIAPTAYHKLAHHEGERATARGARESGVPYTVSMLATTRLEEVAEEGGTLWFQLYPQRDRDLTRSLVERAEAAGYEALVITVDMPVIGRRLLDERNGFGLPPGFVMANMPQATPIAAANAAPGSSLAAFAHKRHDPTFSWKDLDWVRSFTKLPIVLKGVLRADDAARAAKEGVAGVIVSNHGGRQLDSTPASIDALPAVVAAVEGRCDVMMDGGIRWGTDVLKALALGAKAVLVGRPVLWGLTVGGAEGVTKVLGLLKGELERAMALAGAPTLAQVTPDLVSPRT